MRFLLGRDRRAAAGFLMARYPSVDAWDRLRLLWAFVHVTNHVRAYHAQAELLTVADRILSRGGHRPLVVVEAGAGKGASTAKLSLALRAAGGGRLHVFDSFRGIPDNDEVHVHHDGRTVRFRKGAFAGRLESVKRTIARFGAPELCVYHRGWFTETLPRLDEPVDVALLDVDLWSSTRDCLVHLFPRLRPDGVLFSQDGHLRTITDRLADPDFWRLDVGVPYPRIRGLGEVKLIEMTPGPTELRDQPQRPPEALDRATS